MKWEEKQCQYKESEIPENDTSHFRVAYNFYSGYNSFIYPSLFLMHEYSFLHWDIVIDLPRLDRWSDGL